MEELYTSLSQTGLNLEEAARGGSALLSAGRDRYPSSELGSPEYIEHLRRTQRVVARTSFRRPQNAESLKTEKVAAGRGAKFEYLGKASCSLGESSRANIQNGSSARYFQSTPTRKESKQKVVDPDHTPKPSRHEKTRRVEKVVNGNSTGAVASIRRRNIVHRVETDNDSSDELNLTSSSQPIETPRRPSVFCSDTATGPPGSDSDDYGPQQNMNADGTSKQAVSPLSPRKTKSRSSGFRPRGDENSISDETPEKKKAKIKPRTAYGERAKIRSDCSTVEGSSNGKFGARSSTRISVSSDQASSSMEKSGIKTLRDASSYQPLRSMLEDKRRGEENLRPKKSIKGKPVDKPAPNPFPIAKKEADAGVDNTTRDTFPTRPAPFPLSNKPDSSNDTRHFNSHVSGKEAKRKDSNDNCTGDDPLHMNSNDEIILRGGLAPFPMSQDHPNNPQNTSNLPKETRPQIRGSEIGKKQNPKDIRRGSSGVPDVSDTGDYSFAQAEDHPDPKTLCPYCDMPFPPNPSPLLLDMLKRIPKYSDARPTNPLGLRAPLLSYVSMCQRHQFEMQLLPTAQAAGWPTYIDFAALPKRISAMRQRLAGVLHEKETSAIWSELKEDIVRQGVRKTMGISNQFDSFEKSQPGYYGEQGAVIISQALNHLFPPDTIDANLVVPLTPAEFLRCVLVPECAVALIQEDLGRGTSIEYAIRTLRESSKYGTAMFPDLDNRDAMSLAESHGGGQRVGDSLVQERARARRMEIDEARHGEALADELKKRERKSCDQLQSQRSTLKSDKGQADAERKPGANRRTKTKSSAYDRKVNGDIIELSDSSSIRTDTSLPRRSQKPRIAKASDISDYSSKSSMLSNPSQLQQSRADLTAIKPRPRYTARSKASSIDMSSDEQSIKSDVDEPTPRPAARMGRDLYESDSDIVLPEENNRCKKSSQRKIESSSSRLRLKGSVQPLQAVKAPKTRKEAVFRKTMWENDEESEDGESDSLSSPFETDAAARKTHTASTTRTDSHSWLWSDPSTPNVTPSD